MQHSGRSPSCHSRRDAASAPGCRAVGAGHPRSGSAEASGVERAVAGRGTGRGHPRDGPCGSSARSASASVTAGAPRRPITTLRVAGAPVRPAFPQPPRRRPTAVTDGLASGRRSFCTLSVAWDGGVHGSRWPIGAVAGMRQPRGLWLSCLSRGPYASRSGGAACSQGSA